MDMNTIEAAEQEALRFLSKIAALKSKTPDEICLMYGTPETSAVKRASMDLTRQLAKMRRGEV